MASLQSSSSTTATTGELWSQILRESSRQTSQLPCTHLVLLGDRNCGKTSLLIKLQQRQDQVEQLTKGVALDYSFLEVLDDDSDDVLGRINVWQLEGERQHIDLLSFAVNASNIHHTVALVALDLSEPWNLDKCLNEWLDCIREHVQSLRLPTAVLQGLREANEKRFSSYTEPVPSSAKKLKASFLQISKRKADSEDDDDATTTAAATATGGDAAPKRSPSNVETIVDKSDELPPGVLVENWGIPIIVIGCKSDVLLGAPGQRYHFTDDQVDYIQQHLRRICLAHGASLLFSSSTRETNCTVLQDYIEHLLYGFDFVHSSQVVDKGSLFIPFGWDSLEKIQLDFDTQRACSDPSIPFNQVIKKPSALDRGIQIDMEHVEEYQEFLARHKHTLEKRDFAKAATSGQASDAASPRAPSAVSATAAPASPAVVDAPQSLFLDLGLGSTTPSSSLASPSAAIPNSDAIHNFFQSLLEGSSQDASADRELQSQLDKLQSPSQK